MVSQRVARAREQWSNLSNRLKRFITAEMITVNDDFTDHHTDVPALIRRRRPLAVAAQEGKRTDYRKAVKGLGYGVRQWMSSEATRGVAILWDRRQASRVGSARNKPRQKGSGYAVLVGAKHGILARGVIWQDVKVKRIGLRKLTPGYRRVIRLASTHRPPQRADESWPEFDAALNEWLRMSPHPVLLGLDNNSEERPDIARRWVWSHIGIDGALTDVLVSGCAPLDQSLSDHRAVSVEVLL